jgi:hypothetical protein
MESYFFVAVSTSENFELCKRYACAGFPNTINGLWAYEDIGVGDFITFLYGARAHNLYKVVRKEAVTDAQTLPPWPSIHFRKYNKVYYFPYRLGLELIRVFEEPLARPEFMYIAENLLRRGGYEKSHFQADQTTLYNVSQMGVLFQGKTETLKMPQYTTFQPRFKKGTGFNLPELSQFREMILQAVLRRHLSQPANLKRFFEMLGCDGWIAEDFEVLGEKAITEGCTQLQICQFKTKKIYTC